MATYKRDQDYATNTINPADDYSFNDWMIYGSSRLGSQSYNYLLGSYTQAITWVDPLVSLRAGRRTYELTNHLGNVLATISDLPQYNDINGDGNPDYTSAYVQTAQDYYPFGMLMPTRNINSSGYRFSFNGKENDNEVKGAGNQQNYGFRIYDPRLAKFLSVDPLTKEYPWNSTYAFAENSPIKFIDLDGLEKAPPENNKPTTILKTTTTLEITLGAQASSNDLFSVVPFKFVLWSRTTIETKNLTTGQADIPQTIYDYPFNGIGLKMMHEISLNLNIAKIKAQQEEIISPNCEYEVPGSSKRTITGYGFFLKAGPGKSAITKEVQTKLDGSIEVKTTITSEIDYSLILGGKLSVKSELITTTPANYVSTSSAK